MKTKALSFLAMSALSIVLLAQDGRNLAYNGDFKVFEAEKVSTWVTPPQPYVTWHKDGGPDNLPYVAMRFGGDDEYENKLRHKYVQLVAGEKYHLSAYVRTKDFSAKRGELLVVNIPWYNEVGIKKFPANTDGWQKFETDIVCPRQVEKAGYDIVVLIIGQRGEFDIADIRLTALTATAAEKSVSVGDTIHKTIHLIPYGRSFDEVPADKPEITLVWHGQIGDNFKAEDYLVEAVSSDGAFKSPRIPFSVGKPFAIPLLGIVKGKHELKIRIVSKAHETVGYEETFAVNVRDIPADKDVTQGVRLNNMTVELLNKPVKAGEPSTFTLAHDTWVYLTIKDIPNDKPFGLILDGKAVGIDELTGLPEAFRLLSAGTHAVASNWDGTLVARTIPELFSCGMNQGPDIAIFPPFDWNFAKKYALDAVTTLNRGSFVKNGRELVDAAHRSGRIWLEDMYVVNCKDSNDMAKLMERKMAALDFRDGNTSNEVGFGWYVMNYYTPALKTFKYDHSKLIYTWNGTTPPFSKIQDQDFIGAAFNAGNGRGKILHEVYMKTKNSEEEARNYVLGELLPVISTCKMIYPDYIRRAGIILGNFNQLNVITIEHHPKVDFKYYLDLQWNLVANNPEFEGIGVIGYWGTNYTDEELYRWSHRLLRHYGVEGRRDMLSARYGFTYIPGHIVNNDFEDGLSGWTVESAEDGSISIQKFKGYGLRNQERWSSPSGCGDQFCVLKAVAGKPNRVSQIAQNLVPGKQYMLLFSVGDYDDLKKQVLNPRRLGLDAILENAEILPESTVYVDSRQYGKYKHNHNVARQNLHRIIFKPKSSTMKITFTDAKAKPGENLMFNYVQVKPLFQIQE